MAIGNIESMMARVTPDQYSKYQPQVDYSRGRSGGGRGGSRGGGDFEFMDPESEIYDMDEATKDYYSKYNTLKALAKGFQQKGIDITSVDPTNPESIQSRMLFQKQLANVMDAGNRLKNKEAHYRDRQKAIDSARAQGNLRRGVSRDLFTYGEDMDKVDQFSGLVSTKYPETDDWNNNLGQYQLETSKGFNLAMEDYKNRISSMQKRAEEAMNVGNYEEAERLKAAMEGMKRPKGKLSAESLKQRSAGRDRREYTSVRRDMIRNLLVPDKSNSDYLASIGWLESLRGSDGRPIFRSVEDETGSTIYATYLNENGERVTESIPRPKANQSTKEFELRLNNIINGASDDEVVKTSEYLGEGYKNFNLTPEQEKQIRGTQAAVESANIGTDDLLNQMFPGAKDVNVDPNLLAKMFPNARWLQPDHEDYKEKIEDVSYSVRNEVVSSLEDKLITGDLKVPNVSNMDVKYDVVIDKDEDNEQRLKSSNLSKFGSRVTSVKMNDDGSATIGIGDGVEVVVKTKDQWEPFVKLLTSGKMAEDDTYRSAYEDWKPTVNPDTGNRELGRRDTKTGEMEYKPIGNFFDSLFD